MAKRHTRFNRKIFILAGLVVLLIAIASALFLKHNQKLNQVVIPSTPSHKLSSNPPSAENPNSVNSPSPPAASSEADKSSLASGNSTLLVAPSGNFVSNHNPGSGAPTQEQSACNTTPGAYCYIKFVKSDGTVKTLSSQKTDANGSTIWSWDVKDAGFSSGSWQVSAVATLGSQTKTTSDPIALRINS